MARRSVLISTSLAAGLLLLTATASADFKICNKTDHDAAVALAFREHNMWTSEGWWVIAPGSCDTLVTGELLDSPYYVHARHLTVGGLWQGSETFCVGKGSFTAKGRQECVERGFLSAGFFALPATPERNLTLDLTPLAALEENGKTLTTHTSQPQ